MANILLVEPDYRSKFPPIGLLRIASYHKSIGNNVTFTRGKNPVLCNLKWHKIYISSLFTYELPRTVRTIKYYRPSVLSDEDIIVGGIAVTLLPEYIKKHATCKIIEGPLSTPSILDHEKKAIAKYIPDYSIMNDPRWPYQPKNSYFCRISIGCIRKCKFCAVPQLEPKFGYFQPLRSQIKEINNQYGEMQHLILMDNNILACDNLESIINDIKKAGFERGALKNKKKRYIDFNQGIDVRLINKEVSKLLSTIALSPVRLAFDYKGIKKDYLKAIDLLCKDGFDKFTNYLMFNFNDDPVDFYNRMRLNLELSDKYKIRITGFPMRYVPIHDITRRYISPGWKWRFLRGIQCVLLATHGMVSPHTDFFNTAFGTDYNEFLEILSMPDRYIIYRVKYENNEADNWKKLYRKLTETQKDELYEILFKLRNSKGKKEILRQNRSFCKILDHYYPDGNYIECR
jgi:hypothetical protein